jgi:hypothetical protein
VLKPHSLADVKVYILQLRGSVLSRKSCTGFHGDNLLLLIVACIGD